MSLLAAGSVSPHPDLSAPGALVGDVRPLRRLTLADAGFFIVCATFAVYALVAYGQALNGYEKAMLVGAVPALAWLGWLWRPLRRLALACGASALLAVWLYSGGGGWSRAISARPRAYSCSGTCWHHNRRFSG